MTSAPNPLLEELEACDACGAPVFTLRYGSARDPAGDGEPRSWMTVVVGPTIEPIAGGVYPASVCTECGRITDLQSGRAIIWNVAQNGSPVPKLVPPVVGPWTWSYDVWPEWDDADSSDALHLQWLRGFWAGDIELEAAAIDRLLDAERRLHQGNHTDEVRDRALELLQDPRLSWNARISLHAELGREALSGDASEAYRHLRMAVDLARDDAAFAAYRSEPDGWASPDVPWLAIDAAEAADRAGSHDDALELLRWAVPRCGERDVKHGGAALGAPLARDAGDLRFQLECELITLEELCLAWRDDDSFDPIADAWPQLKRLVSSDPSGDLRARAVELVCHWFETSEKQALLRLLASLDG